MTTFDPGPWHITPVKNRDETHIHSEHRLIGETIGLGHEANARLIEQTPALLEALIDMEDNFGHMMEQRVKNGEAPEDAGGWLAVLAARAAIAAAMGK